MMFRVVSAKAPVRPNSGFCTCPTLPKSAEQMQFSDWLKIRCVPKQEVHSFAEVNILLK